MTNIFLSIEYGVSRTFKKTEKVKKHEKSTLKLWTIII